ncbi:hypothetical protein V6N11_076731 [Hibiscus sabdariffa]|uniref:UGP3-like C-terminal hexapeptide repeats domain-containing protein n=1 Tax=Hibiscus sabdariffa TaxID=183260 RepID=A0ABR2A4I6_9ROSI
MPTSCFRILKPNRATPLGFLYCSVPGGRLECTMQNIADNFLDKYYPSRCYKDVEDKLDTDIVNNEWRRVTSSAKKKRKPADTSLHQILDSSPLDIMQNAYDLLSQCDVDIPEVYCQNLFEPNELDIGIWLKVIRLGVAEFLGRNIQIEGSMIIAAKNIMGSTRVDDKGADDASYIM